MSLFRRRPDLDHGLPARLRDVSDNVLMEECDERFQPIPPEVLTLRDLLERATADDFRDAA